MFVKHSNPTIVNLPIVSVPIVSVPKICGVYHIYLTLIKSTKINFLYQVLHLHVYFPFKLWNLYFPFSTVISDKR